MDVDQLTVFVAVVRTGSFTAAARMLGSQKSHASRVVSRLERSLGVQLLQRSTRALALTEVGRELYERATAILSALDDTENAIQQTKGEPYGTLRLTCGVEFGLFRVSRWIIRFLKRYPRMRVDADYTNRLVDLIHEGFDLAIRIGPLVETAGLSARRLGEMRYALYAHPRYLKRRSAFTHPSALSGQDLIVFAPSPSPRWQVVNGSDRFEVEGPYRLLVNSHMAACDGATDGLGVALLPRVHAEPGVRDGTLMEVFSGWTRPPVPIHAVFASNRYLTPKVRAFIDLARAEARDL